MLPNSSKGSRPKKSVELGHWREGSNQSMKLSSNLRKKLKKSEEVLLIKGKQFKTVPEIGTGIT